MGTPIGIHPRLVLAGASAAFVLAWSSGFLGARLGTADASPVTLLLWRFLVVTAVLGLGLTAGRLVRRRRPAAPRGVRGTGAVPRGLRRRRPHPRAVAHHVLVGLLSQVGYVLPVYGAIGLGVSAGTTSLVDALQPVLAATLVGPLLGLRVRALQWVGLAVAAAGVVLLVVSDLRVTAAPGWAYALPVAAVASLLAGTFLERRRPTTLPATTMLALHATVSAAALGVLAAATGDLAPPSAPSFWSAIALTALVPSLAAYALYWWLLRRVDVTVLNALLFLVVPTTTVAGAVLFGEPATGLTAAGVALSGLGVAAVVRGERRHAAPA
ncbi:DMT family transporter [Isoptericola cucumis]|uniref:Membrane protein n=1 Tax=Isoptericola cucumis TaxID=1776856 RepID=A0ABQ2B6S9_9MICO|nr:DMT family transporter [Isoptericola cucumis]GGI07545.1 membrane protein [Isoptericola cucumis]